jgi:hypothetical protein
MSSHVLSTSREESSTLVQYRFIQYHLIANDYLLLISSILILSSILRSTV